MIDIRIKVVQNHIERLQVRGHAGYFDISQGLTTRVRKEFSESKGVWGRLKEGLFSRKKTPAPIQETQSSHEEREDLRAKGVGSIACAAVSVLCKSFIETMVLYSEQKKAQADEYIQVSAEKEGELDVLLTPPQTDPMHVHRYGVEQMLILGVQAVALEYKNDVKLEIEGN